MVEFVDIAPVSSSIIMVVGVGGGGSNAVNHMYKLGIADVSFMVCNTDRQALGRSPIPTQIRLGETLTEGLGAGNNPERGRAAAEESIEDIKEVFREKNIKMVFVTAGMGGGTGTGAAPVIAKAAKEMGILTVAIVTIPFKTEGPRRIMQALNGIEEIRHNVDSLLVVNNENINEIYGDLTLSEAFGKADDILAAAAKSIADIITQENHINVDFADVRTVMAESGIALMGSARGSGENRAREVAEAAMKSPLLNHRDIAGAKNVLLTITSGTKEVTMTETRAISQFVQDQTGLDLGTDLIWGAGIDESLGDDIRITIIATGFDVDSIPLIRERYVDVVGPDSRPGRNRKGGGDRVSEAPVQPQRHTVDLIDLDNQTAKNKNKKNKALADRMDDFAVVTHQEDNVPVAEFQAEPYQPRYYERFEPVVEHNQGAEQMSGGGVVEPVAFASQGQATTVATEEVFRAEALSDDLSQQVGGEGDTDSVLAGGDQEGERVADGTDTDYPVGREIVMPAVAALSEDELTNIPAYIRRGMKIEAELPAGGKVSRETLKNEGGRHGSSHSRGRDGGNGGGHHLFD